MSELWLKRGFGEKGHPETYISFCYTTTTKIIVI